MKIKNTIKNSTGFLLCTILSLLIIVFTNEDLIRISLFDSLELKTIDLRFQERGELIIADSSDVIILEITQESYDQIPPPHNVWPWSRSIFAKIINNLNDAGVRAIGIDLIMSQKDQYDLRNDSLLIDAIKKTGKVVVAGKLDTDREQLIRNIEYGQITRNISIQRKDYEDYGNLFYRADSSLGIVNVPNDNDGVYRRYYPFVYSAVTDNSVPTFAFAILNKYYGLEKNNIVEIENKYFKLGDKYIPKFNSNSFLINYYSIENNKDFRMVNLIDVLDDTEFQTKDEIDFDTEINTWDDEDFRNLFKNKIVLIGSTMPEDKDYFPVSISQSTQEGTNLMYGVKLHATAIQNIIKNDFIVKETTTIEILRIFVSLFLFFIITSSIKKNKKINYFFTELMIMIIIIISLYIYYKLSVFMFIEYNLLLSIVSTSLAIILGYISSTVYYLIKERHQTVLIKSMFSHYVSSSLVNELIANPEKLKLGGEKKKITVLFSDIVGFSTFSEKMSAENLVTLINEYLSSMTEIILKNKGTLDKYIGDAIMAFWGAPVPDEKHAYFACKAALKMKMKLNEININFSKKNFNPISVRIGINTGEVVVGNMGGQQRFDYTIMGDEVNLASRLEGANKEYGTMIMIAENTQKEIVNSDLIYRELDRIRVKGKENSTLVFELIGFNNDINPEIYSEYNFGLINYKERNFKQAIEYFEKSKLKLADKVSEVYINRCKFYLENQPPENWDGVFEMTTK